MVIAVIFCLLAWGAAAYMFYIQRIAGERLVSFRENVEAWDQLNRASYVLNNGEANGPTIGDRLRALVFRDESDTVAFLAHIDELGRQTGVIVSASELKSVKTSSAGFDHIAITLSLRGSPTGVDNMITLLERLPYHSHIEELTLTRMNGAAEAVVALVVSVLE